MQSITSRVAVVLVALALSAVLFVALSDGGSGDSADTEVAVEQDGTTSQPELKAADGKPEPKPKPEPEPKPKPEVPEIVVEGGQPVGGVKQLEFRSGETIRFDIVSDTADELHVHTYDVYVDLEPGKTAEVKIPATIEGVVEAEMHHSLAPVAEISIVP